MKNIYSHANNPNFRFIYGLGTPDGSPEASAESTEAAEVSDSELYTQTADNLYKASEKIANAQNNLNAEAWKNDIDFNSDIKTGDSEALDDDYRTDGYDEKQTSSLQNGNLKVSITTLRDTEFENTKEKYGAIQMETSNPDGSTDIVAINSHRDTGEMIGFKYSIDKDGNKSEHINMTSEESRTALNAINPNVSDLYASNIGNLNNSYAVAIRNNEVNTIASEPDPEDILKEFDD